MGWRTPFGDWLAIGASGSGVMALRWAAEVESWVVLVVGTLLLVVGCIVLLSRSGQRT